MALPWNDEEAVEDDAPWAALAAAGWTDEVGERQALLAIAEAADVAGERDSKGRVLLRLLKRAREPAIVFSEYRDTAERLFRQLSDAGHRVRLLHGGLAPHDRSPRRLRRSTPAGPCWLRPMPRRKVSICTMPAGLSCTSSCRGRRRGSISGAGGSTGSDSPGVCTRSRSWGITPPNSWCWRRCSAAQCGQGRFLGRRCSINSPSLAWRATCLPPCRSIGRRSPHPRHRHSSA